MWRKTGLYTVCAQSYPHLQAAEFEISETRSGILGAKGSWTGGEPEARKRELRAESMTTAR